MAKASQGVPTTAAQAPPVEARRGFLTRFFAVLIGGIVVFVPTLSGMAAFLAPLSRRRATGDFLRVGTLASLPDDGVPRRVSVIAEHIDAWNRTVEPVGAVYLRRAPGQSTPECWTAICPHAGCFVDFDKKSSKFKCPCHNSSFTVEGQIIQPSPSPRPMDSLECKVENGEILVQFESFYCGITEKRAKA